MATTTTEREYTDAETRLVNSDGELAAVLEKLAEARKKGHAEDITKHRVQAQKIALKVETDLEAAFSAHRAYWLEQAKQAESKLAELAMPMMSFIDTSLSAAGVSYRPGTMQNLWNQSRDKFLPASIKGSVPLAAPVSPSLSRAEHDL